MRTQLIPVALNYQRGSPRTVGVHVSSIIRRMAVDNKILKGVNPEDLSLIELDQEGWWQRLSPLDRLRMSIGLAWEDWYIPQLEDVVYHPGEMVVDGIYMTHDGESIDQILRPYRTALHEVKATYKSTKTVGDLESQWMWLTQTKAYCKGLKTTIAYIHVLFLCGDYAYPIQPILKCWRVEFTQEEVDQNWDTIVSMAQHYQRQEAEALYGDTY